jgi:glucokinase
LRRLGGAAARAQADCTKVVLGPGTGLGVAALVPAGGRWQAVASEGGHVTFGPCSGDEEPVFARMRVQGPGSAEAVLSGPGIARLHRAMHAGTAALAPRDIAARALAGDPRATATIRLFTRLLGRFAGDAALTFKATGGVYISGGVARRLGPLLDGEIFRTAFEAHPPYEEMLKAIPTFVVTYEQPGLLGCAALADMTMSPL